MHRWDAELAIGQPAPLPLEIASDGLTEFLGVHRFSIEELKLPHIQIEASDVEGNPEAIERLALAIPQINS